MTHHDLRQRRVPWGVTRADRIAAIAIRAEAKFQLAELHGPVDPAEREQLRRAGLHVLHAVDYSAAERGELPAEALPAELREDLVQDLHARGLTDLAIAIHTRQSTYTVARIRGRLQLAPNERLTTRILSFPTAAHHTAEQLPTSANRSA